MHAQRLLLFFLALIAPCAILAQPPLQWGADVLGGSQGSKTRFHYDFTAYLALIEDKGPQDRLESLQTFCATAATHDSECRALIVILSIIGEQFEILKIPPPSAQNPFAIIDWVGNLPATPKCTIMETRAAGCFVVECASGCAAHLGVL